MSETDNKGLLDKESGNEKIVERGGGDADVLDQTKANQHQESATKESQHKESQQEESSHVASQHKGLFEQPIVIEGKRERKKVERLSASQIVREPKKKKEVVFMNGKGTALGEIPYIATMLTKTTIENCNILHRCLFNANASMAKVKPNIRQFNGFDFEKDSKEYVKRDDLLNRAYWLVLNQQFLKVLGIEKGKAKEDTVTKILDFLMIPYDHGRDIPGRKKSMTKKRRSSASDKGPKGKKTKTDGEDGPDSSDDDQEDSGAESGGDVDADEESAIPKASPKKKKVEKSAEKKKKTPKSPKNTEKTAQKKKKTPAKKDAPKRERKKKDPSVPRKKAASKKAEQHSNVELSTDATDSDDEPLVKKKAPPNDTELKQTIQKILDGANLEQVTMKTVCQAVYSRYPDFDLTHRKDFIKSTVRELIN